MILYGADEEVSQWVSNQIYGKDDFFEKSKAIGIILDNKLICGVVYNNYIEDLLIEMSIASIDKRWCNRHNLRAFFSYPFIQLGLERVQALCHVDNEGVISMNKRLGFKIEGFHPKAHPLGDAVSMGMLKSDCRWL